jgi:membrane protein implicated in regulation of membrane protease activity
VLQNYTASNLTQQGICTTMDLDSSTLWWLIAGALVAAELLTGTFYLLMLALGACAGAVAAHLHFGLPLQLLSAAAVSGFGIVGWHQHRKRQPGALPATANPDVNLDVGQTVEVDSWQMDRAEVQHRGARWQARYIGSTLPSPGRYTIRALEGNCLLLDR